MPVVDLIPQIIKIAKEHDTPTAKLYIERLFAEHDVHKSIVKQWTQEEMDNAKNDGGGTIKVRGVNRNIREFDKPAPPNAPNHQDEYPEPGMEKQFLVDGKPVRQADDDELKNAMKRLGM